MAGQFNINMYAAYATAFLAANTLNADVIYTDVDPDLTLSLPGSMYELDLNNDGQIDFTLTLTSSVYYDYYYWYTARYIKRGVYVSPKNGNAVAGSATVIGEVAYPYALPFGVEVGPYPFSPGSYFDLFYQNEIQTLAYIFDRTLLVGGYGFAYGPSDQAGNWQSISDKFLGLQLNAFDHTYYGWLRLYLIVEDDYAFVTIKDHAYENKRDIPITTFIAPTDILSLNNASTCDIYTAGNTLHVILQPSTSANSTISVYDLSGKLVHLQKTSADHTTVDISPLPGGNYIVQVKYSEKVTSKQVFISP